MSAAERWRPRVVRTTGSVTEAIYGLILATSVIAVSREYDSSNAGRIGVTVLVTGVVFWLAHVYARVLARTITQHGLLTDLRCATPFATTGRWWRSPFRWCSSSRWERSTSSPTRQRFSRRRSAPWWSWALPVRTGRARQEQACAGRSCQPLLPCPSAARSSCSKPSCTDAITLTRGDQGSAPASRKGGGFYGYKVHAAVCTVTGLPVAWTVATASAAETNFVLPLIDATRERGFTVKAAIMDKGYDIGPVHDGCMDRGISPHHAPTRDVRRQARRPSRAVVRSTASGREVRADGAFEEADTPLIEVDASLSRGRDAGDYVGDAPVNTRSSDDVVGHGLPLHELEELADARRRSSHVRGDAAVDRGHAEHHLRHRRPG